MISEQRPVEPFVDRVQQGECNAECDREGREPRALTRRRRRRRALRRGAVESGESLACVQGLRHDPTPRKSLATWPTTKEYHTHKARKMVTHLRTAAYSSDGDCRQKYQ